MANTRMPRVRIQDTYKNDEFTRETRAYIIVHKCSFGNLIWHAFEKILLPKTSKTIIYAQIQ